MSAAPSNLQWDPEYQKVVAELAGVPLPQAQTAHDLRANTDLILRFAFSRVSPAPSVVQTVFHFTSKDGASLAITRFAPPTTAPGPGPAILYIHGGGLVAGSVPITSPAIAATAEKIDRPIFAVSYRLAPEHPFPTPLDDVYAALEWLRTNAATHGIDPARICVYGASAGGNLAAAVALLARDRGLTPPIAKQLLVYPMLDDRTKLATDSPLTALLTWTLRNNEIGWEAYLGGVDKTKVPSYAVPARMDDLSGLPRTYIDVGGCDLFAGEDIAVC